MVAVVVVIVVASNTHLHSSSSGRAGQTQAQHRQHKKKRTKAKVYVVKSGDTLISIARKTGIPVAELQALNPEVDPQILIAGEKLKLQK